MSDATRARSRCRRARCAARRRPSAARRRSRARRPSVSSRSAAWIADALFLSRYAGLAVENHSASTAVPSGAERRARRAASTRHRGGVLVVGGDRPGALAAAGAEGLGDLAAVEAAERDVAGRADDSSHAGESRRAAPDTSPAGRGRVAAARTVSPVQLGDIANDGARAVRQAARRRARARGRADAGAPVRDPDAGPARRRRREGRAPRARRVGPGVDAGDARPRGPQGRRDLPAQQLRQAQRRHRPEVARRAASCSSRSCRTSTWSPRTSSPARWTAWASATTTIAARAPARDLRVDLRLRQHGRDAVPRLAGVRVDRRGDVGHLRLPPSRRAAGDDPGRRARRHQLGAVRRDRHARRAAPPRPHRRGPVRRHRDVRLRWSR